ncbi:MAG: HDIG domain-containing protein [Eubacteriales bacterium]
MNLFKFKKRKKKQTTKKPRFNKPRLAIPFIYITIAFVACFFILAVASSPQKYDITEGGIAKVTITAPKDVVDEIATEERRQEAMDSVSDVYKQDVNITDSVLDEVGTIFEDAETARSMAQQYYLSAQTDNTDNFDPGKVKWENYLDADKLSAIREKISTDFSDSELLSIASVSKDDILSVSNFITDLMNTELKTGVQDTTIDQVKVNLMSKASLESFGDTQLSLANKAIACLEVNFTYDEAATLDQKEAAADKVSAVIYKEGQNIVSQGEIVTENQYEVLKSLGYLASTADNVTPYFAIFLYVFISYVIYVISIFAYTKELFDNLKKMLLILIVVILSSILSVALNSFDLSTLSAFFAVMIISTLVSPKAAMCTSTLLALLISQTAAGENGFLAIKTLETMIAILSGSAVIIACLRRPRQRFLYISAGLFAGVVHIAIIYIFSKSNLIQVDLASDMLFAVVSALAAALLAIGLMPVFENIFLIASPAKLLEILSTEHVLLKKLLLDAPGTYHHSIIVANLAESAAEAIGADTLLTRASAYYHDIGKIKAPQMFGENQKGQNPHDFLTPKESADVLRSHVDEGAAILKRYKMPMDIIDAAKQHHGNTVMSYFYVKAKENGKEVSEEDFRYKGEKPKTKEIACLFLADSVEAAVRSYGYADIEDISSVISKVMDAKFDDGQLDSCEITRRDLSLIKDAFIRFYEGMYHVRIKYPGQEENNNEA